ncbi:hypothetical protein HDF22_004184 [Mucilaginibacter lappiensis]|uniref:Uncharacterized protein n=1 Tax=Mucilaginibacter lappiensis TaxID=354630 RepID=A0A841JGI6_9SPHI|nr:hypothetical protein [Mucilaginibacter lappiensis]
MEQYVFGRLLFGLKPLNASNVRPIYGTAMNEKLIDLFFIAVGFNQRIARA